MKFAAVLAITVAVFVANTSAVFYTHSTSRLHDLLRKTHMKHKTHPLIGRRLMTHLAARQPLFSFHEDVDTSSDEDELMITKMFDEPKPIDNYRRRHQTRPWGPGPVKVEQTTKVPSVECHGCPEGMGVTRECTNSQPTQCTPCGMDEFTPEGQHFEECKQCSACGNNMYARLPCTSTSDTVCDSCDAITPLINEDYKLNCMTTKKVEPSYIGDTDDEWLDEDEDFFPESVEDTYDYAQESFNSAKKGKSSASKLSEEESSFENMKTTTDLSWSAERRIDAQAQAAVQDDIDATIMQRQRQKEMRIIDASDSNSIENFKSENSDDRIELSGETRWRLGMAAPMKEDRLDRFDEDLEDFTEDLPLENEPRWYRRLKYGIRSVSDDVSRHAKSLIVLIMMLTIFCVCCCKCRRTSRHSMHHVARRGELPYEQLTDDDMRVIRDCANNLPAEQRAVKGWPQSGEKQTLWWDEEGRAVNADSFLNPMDVYFDKKKEQKANVHNV